MKRYLTLNSVSYETYFTISTVHKEAIVSFLFEWKNIQKRNVKYIYIYVFKINCSLQ